MIGAILYKNFKKKNIFQCNLFHKHRIVEFFPLLIFASADKHFVSNRAYDLILFLSKIIQFKLGKLF